MRPPWVECAAMRCCTAFLEGSHSCIDNSDDETNGGGEHCR
jgi:hypothetical protein